MAARAKASKARNGRTASERALLSAGKRLAMAGVMPAAVLLANKGRKKSRRKNPGAGYEQAVDAFRDFHGEDPHELIDFKSGTLVELPRYTTALGDLVFLVVKIPRGRTNGKQFVELNKFGKAWLTRHPTMRQLYAEGGDQSLDLEEFGLSASDPNEMEYLGVLVQCEYFTRKVHLGEDGGTANYVHRFGKRELGRHALGLSKTELIQVGYHVPNEQLIFMGGGFSIPSEGIDG